jgi:hypothetical protein
MKPYPKIDSIYKRDEKSKKFIEGSFAMKEFEYLKDNQWLWDEKIDGTNIRIGWDGLKRSFGGRTDAASIPAHLVERLLEIFPEEKLKLHFPDMTGEGVTLYGEGFGHKIQKVGSEYLPDSCDFILFDVRVGDWWLTRVDVEDIAFKLECRVTKIVGSGTIEEAIQIVKEGFPSSIGTAKAEGLILRPTVPLLTRSRERIITKIKTMDWTK